jgi:hypothetical protein
MSAFSSGSAYDVARSLTRFKNGLDHQLTSACLNGTSLPKCYTKPHQHFCTHRIALSPSIFVMNSLPLSLLDHANEEMVESVSPEIVIGGTYNSYETERLEPDEARTQELEILDKLDYQSFHNEGSAAQYSRIAGTEIVVAYEGKNRVELYRRHSRQIIARITTSTLPDASTMRIHTVVGAKDLIVVSTTAPLARMAPWYWKSQDRTYAVLPFPQAVIPVLRVYGVVDGTPLLPHLRWRVAKARCKAIRKITDAVMLS